MTPLDKDISRESTIKYNNRELQVTLTATQTIEFKQKGMKSGILSISIEQLYKQLIGFTDEPEVVTPVVEEKPKEEAPITNDTVFSTLGNPMVPLHTLRTKNLTSVLPLPTKILFEGIIVEALETEKKRLKDLEPKPKKK